MTVQCAASHSIPPNLCSVPEVTITRSRFGSEYRDTTRGPALVVTYARHTDCDSSVTPATKLAAVCSPCTVIWTTFVQSTFTTSTRGSCQLQTIKQSGSGIGNHVNVSPSSPVTTTTSCSSTGQVPKLVSILTVPDLSLDCPCRCAQFHPKEDYVVSASMDQTVRVWDISGQSRVLNRVPLANGQSCFSLSKQASAKRTRPHSHCRLKSRFSAPTRTRPICSATLTPSSSTSSRVTTAESTGPHSIPPCP